MKNALSVAATISCAALLSACTSAPTKPVTSLTFAEVVALEKERATKCVTEAGPEGTDKHKDCVAFYARTEDARRAYNRERAEQADAHLTATIESMRRSTPPQPRVCTATSTGLTPTTHLTCF